MDPLIYSSTGEDNYEDDHKFHHLVADTDGVDNDNNDDDDRVQL